MHDELDFHQFSNHQDGSPAEKAWNPDLIKIISVGIDIGSSTSHLMFSELLLGRRSVDFRNRFEIVERKILYRSPVLLTPYRDPDTIDTDILAQFIANSYKWAQIEPSQVDTGAVICTGEAVKKKNAEAIVRLFADQGGKFVCATAGPNLEAVLAAHGSGALLKSRGCTIMNVDIGGGTCKLAIAKDGYVIETAAINVGSRLLAWNSNGQINRIEKAGAKIASKAGVLLELGKPLSEKNKAVLADLCAQLLIELIEGKSLSPLAEELLVTPLPKHSRNNSMILFSGGVSEYIYDRESREYGDIGPNLAKSLKERVHSLGFPILESDEGLRATVIGASQYTVQVSSSTIFLSQKDLLPICDLLVVTPLMDSNVPDAGGIAKAIEKAFVRFDLIENPRPVALSLSFPWEKCYDSLKTLGQGVLKTMSLWRHQDPLVLVFETDIGKLVGAILKEELEIKQEVVAIDEIKVGDFDFIDIGEELGHSQAVPVVVKSLVFE